MARYLSAPLPSRKLPGGIPFIIGNEVAERLSFYGMKAILFTFMTKHLLDASGAASFYTETEAREAIAWFNSLAYFFPIIGALISDCLWGKYRTILYISLFYCVGHGLLGLMDAPPAFLQATLSPEGYMMAGLFVIALGAGGIKPCVSAHVGDQFGKSNQHLLEATFGWFYVGINLGAAAAFLLLPWLLGRFGAGAAFLLPGVVMAVATLIFWSGRKRFVHVPPAGPGYFKRAFAGPGLPIILKLTPIFVLIAVFWSLFDQTAAAWVAQAGKMDRNFLGIVWHEAQIGAVNPICILLFVPLFNYVLYPLLGRVIKLTPLRKAGFGMFLMVGAYALTSTIEEWIIAAEAIGAPAPNIGWQVLAYAVLTAAEVLVSITLLQFSYTEARPEMKSLVVGLFYLSVTLGNVFTALVNRLSADAQGNSILVGAEYYWFFTWVMAGAALLFALYAAFYRERTYLQEESPQP